MVLYQKDVRTKSPLLKTTLYDFIIVVSSGVYGAQIQFGPSTANVGQMRWVIRYFWLVIWIFKLSFETAWRMKFYQNNFHAKFY
jgi:hypothetical protein